MFCWYNKSWCAVNTFSWPKRPNEISDNAWWTWSNRTEFAFHFCTDKLATLPPNLKHIKQANQKQTCQDGEAHRNLFYFWNHFKVKQFCTRLFFFGGSSSNQSQLKWFTNQENREIYMFRKPSGEKLSLISSLKSRSTGAAKIIEHRRNQRGFQINRHLMFNT